MNRGKLRAKPTTNAGQDANRDRRRKSGEIFLNMIRRYGSAEVRNAIDALVLPDEDKGCDPGDLGAWFFDLVNGIAGKAEEEVDLVAAYQLTGLTEAEAKIAAEDRPVPQSVTTANEMRKCARRFHNFADKIERFNQQLDPLERAWMIERLPDHPVAAGIIYELPLLVHLYAQSLEDLSDQLPKPKRGRPGMQIFSTEMELCALMSYVIDQTGKQAKPLFQAVATVLRAAYRDLAVDRSKAKVPAIFKSSTFQILYRRRHPRRKRQNVKSALH